MLVTNFFIIKFNELENWMATSFRTASVELTWDLQNLVTAVSCHMNAPLSLKMTTTHKPYIIENFLSVDTKWMLGYWETNYNTDFYINLKSLNIKCHATFSRSVGAIVEWIQQKRCMLDEVLLDILIQVYLLCLFSVFAVND